MVPVISKTGKKLMPTSEYRARKLLAKGKAVIDRYHPFTLRLTEREDGDIQPIEIAIDTGYAHIGNSVKTEKHELSAVEVHPLADEKKRHNDRLMHRRQRRARLRHRKPRFDNRKKKDGWLPPSLEHRKDQNLAYFKQLMKVVPITSITMEMGQFDTQVLKAIEEGTPIPEGKDYQRGERYGIATLREAVFTRDGYTCQCCGQKAEDGVILHVHHIQYRSMGGSNRMGNLITVCDKCHTPKNHKPGGKLWNWKPRVKSFAGATFMTAVRWMMYRKVQKMYPDVEVHITYGAKTKERRRILDIPKSHVNDAFVMGSFHPKHRCRPVIFQKKRRNNRILEKFYDAKYIDSRDGSKKSGQQLFNGRTNRNHNTDTENLHKYRKEKISSGRRSIRRRRYPIQPHDIVRYHGHDTEASGCHCHGTRLLIHGVSVAVNKVRLRKYSGGFATRPGCSKYYQTT